MPYRKTLILAKTTSLKAPVFTLTAKYETRSTAFTSANWVFEISMIKPNDLAFCIRLEDIYPNKPYLIIPASSALRSCNLGRLAQDALTQMLSTPETQKLIARKYYRSNLQTLKIKLKSPTIYCPTPCTDRQLVRYINNIKAESKWQAQILQILRYKDATTSLLALELLQTLKAQEQNNHTISSDIDLTPPRMTLALDLILAARSALKE